MLDGRPVVGFQVYRAKGFDETRIAAQVQETLDALAATHPSLSFDLVTDNVEYTREQYTGPMDLLYQGALPAILVAGFFLRDWLAPPFAAPALPITHLPTLAPMPGLDWKGAATGKKVAGLV